MLDEKGLLAKIDPATLAQVPAKYSASDGKWVGVLARENVLAFNPAMIQANRLPASLLDLAKPEWKGRLGDCAERRGFPAIGAARWSHRRASWQRSIG